MASKNVIILSDSAFESEVMQSTVPVLVDFWATWCGPCQMLSPILDELSEQYAGKIKIAKYDVDQNTQYAQQFGIRGVPTMMIFKNGQLMDKVVGFTPKPELAKKLDAVL